MTIETVRRNLLKYELITKDPVSLRDSCVLRLRVNGGTEELHLKRDNDVPV